MDRIQTVTQEEILDHIDEDNLWSEFGGNCEYSVDDLIEGITQRLEESPIKMHTITKNKKKNKDKDNTEGKKTKKKSKKKVELDGVNVEEIPEAVLDQLQQSKTEEPDSKEDMEDDDFKLSGSSKSMGKKKKKTDENAEDDKYVL